MLRVKSHAGMCGFSLFSFPFHVVSVFLENTGQNNCLSVKSEDWATVFCPVTTCQR